MHYLSMQLDFLVSLLLLLSIWDVSAKTIYEKILEKEHLADKLKLLEPEVLIKNYKDGYMAGTTNRSCAKDLIAYQQAIDQRETWALRMLDASSRVPAGLLEGHVIDLGMFDECLDTRQKSMKIEIRGRHCMYSINPTITYNNIFPFKPTLSICLPDSCTQSDVFNLLNKTISMENSLQDLGVSVANVTCTTNDSNIWTTEYKLCGMFIVIHTGFLTMCTLLHILSRLFEYNIDKGSKLLMLIRFSLLRNAKTISNTRLPEGDVKVIHGIRVISMSWIILVHQTFFYILASNINANDIQKYLYKWTSLMIILGTYSVDTFLTLSGFLVAYRFFKHMDTRKPFNVFYYYLHRYLRLTPLIAMMFFGNVVLVANIATGPRFEWFSNVFITGCRSKWWSFLLYINNFVEKDNYCVAHLWSLAVDMQLFWISPLILYPLYKRPKIGLAIWVLLFLISISLSAAIVGLNKYPAAHLTYEPSVPLLFKIFQDVYTMPYTRASPWLLGLLFGYEAAYKNIEPSKSTIRRGWIVSFVFLAFCVFGIKSFLSLNYTYSPIWEMVFAALARPFWSFYICWIIYACINNSSGSLSKILSWRPLRPLSRISYSVYVIHALLPYLEVSAGRTPTYFNAYSIAHAYISNIFISIVFGFFLCLTCELPVLVLEDMITKRKSLYLRETRKTK